MKSQLIARKEEIRNLMLEFFLDNSIAGPVLEIGSGRNRFNRTLFSKKYKVITSNIYPKNVVDYICSVCCLPFENNKFGCVICEHILEHLEQPANALDEIRRVLKPKGILILVVPFSWPIHEKPYDLWRFTEEGLRHLLMKRFDHMRFKPIGKTNAPNLIYATARKPARNRQEINCPKVSVIMPTYNRAHLIEKSIESVLNQTFNNWELIIISDGSTDKTREVIKAYHEPRIMFLEKTNAGSASARNYGLRRAKGEYIAYCDDDDIIFPWHLETLANYLDRHNEIEFVRGSAVEFSPSQKQGHRETGFLWGLMHKRSILRKVGLFDEKLIMVQDFDFIFRLYDYCKGKHLEFILAKHILHSRSINITREAQHTRWTDQMYVKRVRKIFKVQGVEKGYFIRALYKYCKGNFIKAAYSLAKIFYSQHPCVESAYLLGLSCYRAERISESLKYMEEVVKYSLRSSRRKSAYIRKIKECAYALLGKIYLFKGKSNLSIEYLNQGLKRNPGSLLLKLGLFHACLESGKKGLALEIYKKTRDKATLSYMKGIISLEKKDYKKAEKALNRALNLDKSVHYRINFSLGRLCSEIGRKKDAKIYQEKGLLLETGTYFYILLISRFHKINHSYWIKLLDKIWFFPDEGDNPQIT